MLQLRWSQFKLAYTLLAFEISSKLFQPVSLYLLILFCIITLESAKQIVTKEI